MSCSSPNVQYIPNKSKFGKLRECIVASEGHRLIKADYSQVELRIVAKIAGEEKMLEAYRNGEDLHHATARSITGREEVTQEDRQLAKAVSTSGSSTVKAPPGFSPTPAISTGSRWRSSRPQGKGRGGSRPTGYKGLAPPRGHRLRCGRRLSQHPHRAIEKGEELHGEGQPPGARHGCRWSQASYGPLQRAATGVPRRQADPRRPRRAGSGVPRGSGQGDSSVRGGDHGSQDGRDPKSRPGQLPPQS